MVNQNTDCALRASISPSKFQKNNLQFHQKIYRIAEPMRSATSRIGCVWSIESIILKEK